MTKDQLALAKQEYDRIKGPEAAKPLEEAAPTLPEGVKSSGEAGADR